MSDGSKLASPEQTKQPPPRILVVEDDPDQRELICESLQMYFEDVEGERIASAGTGKDALAMPLHQFDIALLDFNLPDMSGLDVLDGILAERDMPIIFVTSENSAATAAEAIRRGAQDYVVKLGDYLFALPVVLEKNLRQYMLKDENRRLQDELQASLEEIRVKNLQLEDSLRKLKAMAATDHLTGLSNRRAFAEVLERCFNEATRYGFDLTCAMADLDDYKVLNDTLGHQVGDKVLVSAADVIRSNLRGSDTAARYGGDEFVLLLPHTSVAMAINVAERIRRQLIASTRRLTRTGVGVSMSFGIASLTSDQPASANALVSMADRGLYTAKDRGKNTVVTFPEVESGAPAGS